MPRVTMTQIARFPPTTRCVCRCCCKSLNQQNYKSLPYPQVTRETSYCKCAEGYQTRDASLTACVRTHPPPSVITPSPLVALALVLVVLAALLCFVTRLFARARWAPAR